MEASTLHVESLAGPCAEGLEERLDICQLVLEAQRENPQAFGEIYERCAGRIHRYITVMLRDPTEAEDIVQQTFTRAFEALPRFELRDEAHFYGWLFRIARNAALNHTRKHRRLDMSEELSMRVGWEIVDSHLAPEATAGWIDDVHLMESFERLPALQRKVLILRFLLDLETEKIASMLSITPTNVRTAQSRAITSLRVRAAGRPARAGLHGARKTAPRRVARAVCP